MTINYSSIASELICMSDELFEIRLTELCTDLLTEDNQRVRFIKYDPRLPDIRSTLIRSWRVLTEDREMKKVFPALVRSSTPLYIGVWTLTISNIGFSEQIGNYRYYCYIR